jgi:hypothetical protein
MAEIERLRADVERSSAAFDATVRTLRRDKGIAEAERDALRALLAEARAYLLDAFALIGTKIHCGS